MWDVVCVVGTACFFALSFAYLAGCRRLLGE